MSASETYRLSPAQRQAWLRAEAAAHRPLSARLRLSTRLDGARLRSALAAVAEQHEALRLRLVAHTQLRVPLQLVDEERPLLVAEGDIFDGEGDADRPSVDRPLPFSVALTETEDGGQELRLLVSELAADPASLSVLLTDLARAYAGTSIEDPDALQFLDVAEWQHEELETAERPAVAPLTEAIAPLGTYSRASEEQGFGELTTRLADGRAQELEQAAVSLGCAVPDLLLVAWVLVLARQGHGDRDGGELVLGWYDEGRGAEGTERTVGPLGWYTPLRVDLPLPELPRTVVDSVLDAAAAARRAHHLIEPLDPASAGACGFSARFLPDTAELAPLGAVSADVAAPAPFGDLYLGCDIGADAVTLTLRHARGRYPDAAAQRLLDAVAAVATSLSSASADGAGLQLLGEEESALLEEWGSAPEQLQGTDADGTLTALLDAGVRGADADAEAVLDADGGITFAELDRAATALAAHLSHLGVGAGDPVVVLAERSWRTVAAFLGVLRAGGAYVPLDPAGPEARACSLASAVGAKVALAPDAAAPLAAALGRHLTVDDVADVLRAASETGSGQAAGWQPPRVSPDQAAYIIFTSGSTGAPRPVVVEQRSAARLCHALRVSVYSGEPEGLRVAVNAPFTFDASVKQLVQLASGHTLCVVPDAVRQDGVELLAHLAAQRVDVFDCTPSHLRILLAAADGDSAQRRIPRLLLVGGEALDEGLWETLAGLPDVRAVNLYGPTECTVDATWAEVTPGTAPSIGRPLPGVRVRVTDEWLRPAPAGVPGELCVLGPQVARGYLGDEETTARRFVTVGGERLYRTGDRVRYTPDGRLEYLGRIDHQVKIRGFRIEPAEVEAELRCHPGVDRAVVIARDEERGARLVGYVTPTAHSGPTLDPDQLDGVNPHETRYLYDEIFTQQVYLQGGVTLREKPVVLDVGANIGMFSLFVHQLCPDAELYAFEPLAEVHRKLERNLYAAGVRAELFDHGLSDTEREATFTFYPGYSMMSGQEEYADADAEIAVVRRFLSNERDQGLEGRAELLEHADELLHDRFRGTEERARLRRLSDVIDDRGIGRIDLLKVDVQRAELDVLRGLEERHWPLVQQVVMEVHDAVGTPTEGRVDDAVELLESYGFEVRVEQDAVLSGTDRFALSAIRPEYADDPRPVVAEESMDRAPVPDGEALRAWLAERLPAHLVPSAVAVLPALPLTANGKVDRAALPDPQPARRGAVAGAANRAEEILVEAWQEVLGVPEVGVEDDFFSLGGDSIRSIQMQVAAARRGLSFPLRSIFVHQSIRELVREGGVTLDTENAEASEEKRADRKAAEESGATLLAPADRELLPADVEDAYPMSALQLGMVFHTELTGDPATYHNVTAHHMAAPMDPDALRRALAETAARHPILRTSFDLGRYREPLQLVHRGAEPPLAVEDLRHAGEAERGARIEEAMRAELARPFDWRTPPLVRLRALDLGEAGFCLLVSEYHAILDGWSLHLLLDELLERYGRLLAAAAPGTESVAGPWSHPTPYRRFVELERRAQQDPATRDFWLRRLDGVRPLRLMPHQLIAGTGGANGTTPASVGVPRITESYRVPLPEGIGGRLERAAQDTGVPLKSLLLAVHLRALGEAAGRGDVLSGLVTSGRPGEDGADRTLGLFLNTLPVHIRCGARPLADLAHEAWQDEREMMGHHLYPLADIERALGHGRLFDTFFNYVRFHDPAGSEGQPGGADERHHPPVTRRHGVPVDVAFALAVDFEADPGTGELALTFHYDERCRTPEQVAALGARYRQLLAGAAEDAAAPLPKLADRDEPTPRDTWARRVSAAWQELLGTAPREESANFLTSGGSSLLALRLSAVLRDRHGAALTLPQVHADPTYGAVVDMCLAAAPTAAGAAAASAAGEGAATHD